MVAALVLLPTTSHAEGKMREARTADLKTQNGCAGRVAILSDHFERKASDADPLILAAALREANYGVTLLKAGDLADPAVLTAANFDCLILPYGSRYPAAAREPIRAYLKSGGCFLSTGGYALDEACMPNEFGQLTPSEPAATAAEFAKANPGVVPLNTRFGATGDTLGLQPDQIGVFDPCYQFRNAAAIHAAPMQSIVAATVVAKMKVEGFAACSLLGSNSPVFPEKWGRHVPLVEAADSFGRPVGPVGAIAHNYAGPYAGSSWAFLGVTNLDLFAKGGPMLPYVGRIVDALVARTYLHSLSTDLACYETGETVKLTCSVANLGRRNGKAKVRFSIYDRRGKIVLTSDPKLVLPKAGDTRTVAAQYEPKEFASDLYRVTAEMIVDGKVVDTVETGFAARSPKVMAGGLKLKYKNNYFHAGNRPVLMSGTNETGAIFCSGNENPLVWDRDLAGMNDNGLNILRVLHFSPFMMAKPSHANTPMDLNLDRMPIGIERKLDALVQLCQKHRIVLFLTIHDWMKVQLSDKELAAQRQFAKLIASRYKNVPGFMIDIQNEPNMDLKGQPEAYRDADVVREWNSYLKTKYGTDEALGAAWNTSPPEAAIGSIPLAHGKDEWNDMRTFDADYFRNALINRWIDANASGAREGNPNVPVTVGYLQEYWAMNKLACMDKLDFANMHSYNSIDVLRADMKLFDRRFEGKSLSLGEFGSVADHHSRIEGKISSKEDYNRYLLTGHYLFGEGGSFLANWCWKDMDDCIFPWGINYTCGGPRKDILLAFRNQSLLMRQIRPVYRPHEMYLVVPINSMLGGKSGERVRLLYGVVDGLLDARADFGTIDDEHLDQLPSSAKLLIYPSPMSIPDKAYAELNAFLKRGGTLCISGETGYDSLHRDTRGDRLEELRRAGKVYFSSDPGGKMGEAGESVFSEPLRMLGPSASVGADAGHAFRIHEINGGRAVLLVNASPGDKTVRVTEPGAQPVELQLAGNGVGMARFDPEGKLTAVECQGDVKLPGLTIKAQGHSALIARDGKDISDSQALIVIPFGPCEIDLKHTKGLVLQTGDVIDGKWRVLSESSDKRIIIPRETDFDIRIIAPGDHLASMGQYVANELMLK